MNPVSSKKKENNSQKVFKKFICNYRVYPALLFVIIYNSVPSSQSAVFYFSTNELKISPIEMGYISVLCNLSMLISMLIYKKYLQKVSWLKMLTVTTLINFIFGFPYIAMNFNSSFRNFLLLIGRCSSAVIEQFAFTPFLCFASMITPKNFLATGTAIVTTCWNIGLTSSEAFSGILSAYLGITSENFDNFYVLILIERLGKVITLVILCFVKEFIILGNGFDLSCNLSSSYKDFFKRRLDSLFNTTDTDEIINLLNNVSAESSYKREKNNNQSATMKEFKEQQRENESTVSKFTSRKYVIKKPKTIEPGEEDRQFEFLEVQAKYPDITRWDLFFIYAKKYLKDETNEWQDVENIIDNVITIALHDKIRKNVLSMPSSQYVTNLHFKPDGEEKFKLAIYKYSCVNFDETDVNERAYSLLISLNQFEEVFSKYICLQMDIEHSKNLNSPYFQCAKELLKNITEMKLGDRPEINVWSFNYTFDNKFQKIKRWY